MQVILQRSGDRDGLGQVALGGRFLADPPEEAEEGLAGVGVAGAAARVVDEVADPAVTTASNSSSLDGKWR